jgi:hypothetical protein
MKHRYSVIVAHRRLGKTVAVIIHIIQAALKNKLDRPMYGYIAPFYKQAKSIAWEYLKYYTKDIAIRISESELSVTLDLPNKPTIRLFGADHPDSLRGLYFDGICLDEYADMKPTIWTDVLIPALIDRMGWAVFIGTPKGYDAFYEIYQQALRDETWAALHYKATETDIIPAEELEEARKSMGDEQYRREMLCDFTAGADDILVPFELVEEAVKRPILPHMYHKQPKILGIDVARQGSDKTVIQRRQGVMAFEPSKMRIPDQMLVAGRVAQEIDEWEPDAVFIDQGAGYGVIDRLRQLGYKVTEVPFGSKATKDNQFKNKRAEMWFNMKEWLKVGRIPDDSELKADMLTPRYSFDPAGRIVLEKKEDIKERLTRSPDCGDALALTFAFPISNAITQRKPLARTSKQWNPLED